MNYSKEVNQILKRSKEVAEKLLSEHIGTEHLLIAMYESKESIMRFLFEEDKIDMESILKSYYRNISDVKNNLKYTDNFKNILEESSKIAIKYKSKYIYDEHLFYSILTNDCTGNRILKDLKIDFKQYILDVKDIFNIDDTEEYPYLIDMKEQKNNHKYIPRGNYIERIIYILNRKQKHNPLIIGNPGVGKTAIVEGLSKIINQPIYQLNIAENLKKK